MPHRRIRSVVCSANLLYLDTIDIKLFADIGRFTIGTALRAGERAGLPVKHGPACRALQHRLHSLKLDPCPFTETAFRNDIKIHADRLRHISRVIADNEPDAPDFRSAGLAAVLLRYADNVLCNWKFMHDCIISLQGFYFNDGTRCTFLPMPIVRYFLNIVFLQLLAVVGRTLQRLIFQRF